MNTFLLLTYHAWTKPRRTLYRLGEQIDFRTAIILYAVIILLFVGVGAFTYPEQNFLAILWSVASRAAAPLLLSELAHRLTKYGRESLLHGVLLIYISTDLLTLLPALFYTPGTNTLPLVFIVAMLLLILWSFGILIIMLSELIQRQNFVALFLQVVTSLILLSVGYLPDWISSI